MPHLKKEIKDALLDKDFERVAQIALKNKKVFRLLISFAYDKEDLLCWRAIEAMGKAAGAVAVEDSPAVRNIVQRLLWSMGEESGGIGWSGAEMLGEIVRNSPGTFRDIPSIILSFQEEEMFLSGVLWAMGRMAGAGIVLDKEAEGLAVRCLEHEDAQIRGMAVLAVSRMKIEESRARIAEMVGDGGRVRVYEEHELIERTVGDIALSC